MVKIVAVGLTRRVTTKLLWWHSQWQFPFHMPLMWTFLHQVVCAYRPQVSQSAPLQSFCNLHLRHSTAAQIGYVLKQTQSSNLLLQVVMFKRQCFTKRAHPSVMWSGNVAAMAESITTLDQLADGSVCLVLSLFTQSWPYCMQHRHQSSCTSL